MAEILCFSRNRFTGVEQVDEATIRSTCRVQDTVIEAWVEILVRLPNLEITGARGEIRRSRDGGGSDLAAGLSRLTGSRVGPGIKKIVRGLLEDLPHLEQVVALVDECATGVIMSFTRDVLAQAPRGAAGEKEFFAAMVRANPRLYDSCAALAPDSPLMDGVRPGET
ncbi:MAG: hypothetical protein M0Z41_12000 [Peptococcaceae bacterium]|jgi:hypothetical protein|nr:hypothetical protein [Peptococcaceae bacterium]